jgi:hypothetical protein
MERNYPRDSSFRNDGKNCFRALRKIGLRPLHSGLGCSADCGVKRGGYNATEAQNAEETLPAGIAAVSGEIQHALEGDHGSFFDSLARNALEVKIAALGAMSVAREGYGYTSSMKPVVAGVASPGFQIDQCEEKIDRSASMRTKTVRAAALRADH